MAFGWMGTPSLGDHAPPPLTLPYIHFFIALEEEEGRERNTDAREQARSVPGSGPEPTTLQLWDDAPTN